MTSTLSKHNVRITAVFCKVHTFFSEDASNRKSTKRSSPLKLPNAPAFQCTSDTKSDHQSFSAAEKTPVYKAREERGTSRLSSKSSDTAVIADLVDEDNSVALSGKVQKLF